MSERFEDLRLCAAQLAAGGLIALPLIYTDGFGLLDSPPKPRTDIERCFDEPQTPETTTPSKIPQPEIDLKYQYTTVEDDPEYDRKITRATKLGIVQLSTEDGSGSGFVTKNAEGEQVVLTAAHVIGDTKMNDITISTNDGKLITPAGGCYVYENNGEFKELNEEGTQIRDLDLAVLTLPYDLVADERELTVSEKPAQRGNWTHFINYQDLHEPGDPAAYTGIIAGEPTDKIGYTAITGFDKMFDEEITLDSLFNHILPGASGGPVVDADTGEVVGVSTGATRPGYYESKDDLKSTYNIKLTGTKTGYDVGVAPMTAYLMSPALMSAVLSPEAVVTEPNS